MYVERALESLGLYAYPRRPWFPPGVGRRSLRGTTVQYIYYIQSSYWSLEVEHRDDLQLKMILDYLLHKWFSPCDEVLYGTSRLPKQNKIYFLYFIVSQKYEPPVPSHITYDFKIWEGFTVRWGNGLTCDSDKAANRNFSIKSKTFKCTMLNGCIGRHNILEVQSSCKIHVEMAYSMSAYFEMKLAHVQNFSKINFPHFHCIGTLDILPNNVRHKGWKQ